jgi:phage protein D
VALEKLSLSTFNFYAPQFEVEIKGKKLTANIAKAIIDVSVDEKIDEGASFRITVHDEFDMITQKYKWLDHDLFNVGNEITIKMGYAGNLNIMVMGNIKSLEPSFFSGETPTITIGGQDLSYDYMKRATPERTFVDKSYSDIARTIATEAKLSSAVDDTPSYEPFIRKNNNVTYFRFLESIATQVGYEFYIDRKTMYFVKPKDQEKEILTLELGKDIISFRPTMNTMELVVEVEVRGHNPRDPERPIVGRARAGSERNQEPGRRTGSQVVQERHNIQKKVITGRVVNSVEHANSIALSELNKANDNFIKGEGNCIGIPQIRPRVTIRLEKMGNIFSGKYYVKAATHTINNSGYRTHFSVKRNAI